MSKFINSVAMSAAFLASLSVATPAFAGRIAQRKENQQDRIAQGVKSGQLTAGETARLERRRLRSIAK